MKDNSDAVSMLTTQLAILESQLSVRDKRIKALESDIGMRDSIICNLRTDMTKKDVFIKKLQEASAYKTISYDLKKEMLDFEDDAGTVG
jgi:uncharacterized coiled-coil protein SlyX